MPETTFGALVEGDTIKDGNGDVWTVDSVDRNYQNSQVAVGIKAGDKSHLLVRPADRPVTRMDREPELVEAEAVAKEQLGAKVVKREPNARASKQGPTVEATVTPEPEPTTPPVLPAITLPYHLRSHLFLAHGQNVTQALSAEEWVEWHENLHATGVAAHEHTHEA